MKGLSKVVLTLATATMLAGCTTKCSFADFKEAVGKIEDKSYASATVKADGETYKTGSVLMGMFVPEVMNEKTAVYFGMVNGSKEMLKSLAIEESKDLTYYKSFKVAGSQKNGEEVVADVEIVWNKYGWLTKYSYDDKKDNSNDVKFTVSYK